jgi:hypothetical protein
MEKYKEVLIAITEEDQAEDHSSKVPSRMKDLTIVSASGGENVQKYKSSFVDS